MEYHTFGRLATSSSCVGMTSTISQTLHAILKFYSRRKENQYTEVVTSNPDVKSCHVQCSWVPCIIKCLQSLEKKDHKSLPSCIWVRINPRLSLKSSIVYQSMVWGQHSFALSQSSTKINVISFNWVGTDSISGRVACLVFPSFVRTWLVTGEGAGRSDYGRGRYLSGLRLDGGIENLNNCRRRIVSRHEPNYSIPTTKSTIFVGWSLLKIA